MTGNVTAALKRNAITLFSNMTGLFSINVHLNIRPASHRVGSVQSSLLQNITFILQSQLLGSTEVWMGVLCFCYCSC